MKIAVATLKGVLKSKAMVEMDIEPIMKINAPTAGPHLQQLFPDSRQSKIETVMVINVFEKN